VAIDPDDRRNRLITLTEKGGVRLAQSDALWAKAQRGFEVAFGNTDAVNEALGVLISDDFVTRFEQAVATSLK
jgi:DNA-binding MarR family transcriptional regulator